MLPLYKLTVDIIAPNTVTGEEQFREQVAHSISYLDALKGALRREPCSVWFYPHDPENENYKQWSVRCVVMISVGKQRSKHLLDLYRAIVNLIEFELPDFGIRAEIKKLTFS